MRRGNVEDSSTEKITDRRFVQKREEDDQTGSYTFVRCALRRLRFQNRSECSQKQMIARITADDVGRWSQYQCNAVDLRSRLSRRCEARRHALQHPYDETNASLQTSPHAFEQGRGKPLDQSPALVAHEMAIRKWMRRTPEISARSTDSIVPLVTRLSTTKPIRSAW